MMGLSTLFRPAFLGGRGPKERTGDIGIGTEKICLCLSWLFNKEQIQGVEKGPKLQCLDKSLLLNLKDVHVEGRPISPI